MSEVWAPPGPMYMTTRRYGGWGEYDINNDCQKDSKCADCQGNYGAGSRDCEVWKKEKEKTKTYSKYHLSRSEKDGRDYKIRESDKKIPEQPTKMLSSSATAEPEVVAQLVNEMRALIQEIKTVIEAVTEKLFKDPNTRVATSQDRQS